MLNRACACDSGLESGGLGDEPVGHVAAVAVAADSKLFWIGDPVFHQRVDTFQNVFSRAGDNLGNDFGEERVSVAG